MNYINSTTTTSVPNTSARLPLPGSLALGAQHGKLNADLRTSAWHNWHNFTPSVQLIHDYYPFVLEDGGRLAPMAAELVGRQVILVAVSRLPCMGAKESRSLRFDIWVRMKHFVRQFTYAPFRRCLGGVRREFMQRLSIALHGTLGSYIVPRP
jgi:hypothetical protein